MNWLDELLEPLLDRLAQKLADKFRAELDGAIDAALDRADDRIDTAVEGLEERLLAAANKAMEDVLRQVTAPIAELKAAVAPAIELQQQVQLSAEAAGMITAKEFREMTATAAAAASAIDRLRTPLTPTRPWKEMPDR